MPSTKFPATQHIETSASDVWASNPPVLYVECAGVQYAVPSALTNEPPKMQVISEALLVI